MSGSPTCRAATKPDPKGWLITMRPVGAKQPRSLEQRLFPNRRD